MVKDWHKLSVLIAGCGSIGKRHARVLQGMGVKDLRACDPSAEQRQRLAQETPVRLYSAYEAALADRPDTVFICTPPQLHIAMAHQALAAGAPVFCEKPLSYSSAGIDELAAHARRVDQQVAVGYCYRHHDGLRKAKTLLESGKFGRLVSIRCLLGEYFPAARPDYRSMYMSQYGGAYELIHGVDLAVWFAASPAQKVRCVAGTYSEIGIAAPDLAEITVSFANRCLASIHLDLFSVARRFQTELICTEGIILVDFSRWDQCRLSVYTRGEWAQEEIATDRDDMFRAEDGAFLAAVVSGATVECGIAEARQAGEILERAQLDAQAANGAPPPS